jgi:uncharacterized GH25 family protein
MRRRVTRLTLLAALFSPLPACAHDFWIEPSLFQPPVGSPVGIHLRVGEHFQGDPVARAEKHIVRFVLVTSSGESPVLGAEGSEPAGIARVAQPGVHIVAYRSNNARVDLEPEKFEQYLKEEGLESVIAERARRSESQKPSREAYSRSVKSLLCAGDCAMGADRAVGLALELVSENNPYAARAGEKMPFRLLWNGKPLEGALVVALSKGSPETKLSARTDASGRVTFRLPRGGIWLVKTVHMTRAPAGGDVDWESLWASLTFELRERLPRP